MSADGNGPSALAIDPAGQLVYAFTPGSSFSIWSFTINYASGTTNGSLVATTSSPFSLSAGGIFALFDPAETTSLSEATLALPPIPTINRAALPRRSQGRRLHWELRQGKWCS